MKKYIPYASSSLILLGVVRLILYYHIFNIKIINFLDFSEILVSFFDILFLLFIVAISITGLSLISPQNNFHLKRNIIVISSIIMLLTIAGMIFGNYNSILNDSLIFVIIFSFWILVISIFGIRKNENKLKEEIIAILILLSCLVAISLYNFIEGNWVITKKMKKEVVIRLDDKEIISNDSIYYIGNTKNYIFIYKEKSQVTDVYPMSKVKEIHFSKNSQLK